MQYEISEEKAQGEYGSDFPCAQEEWLKEEMKKQPSARVMWNLLYCGCPKCNPFRGQ